METRIVNASAKDVQGLIKIYSSPDLYHTWKDASWFVRSFFDYHHIKIVKAEQKVVGAAFWNVVEEKHHGVTEIGDLWIDEDYRRKGLGEKLLRTIIEDMTRFFAKENHALRKVLVTTGDDNEPAKRLYEKIGFRESAVLTDLFAEGENELLYILTLNS
jgi:ribosomal protein S18 acetylase RimI-like enzyme